MKLFQLTVLFVDTSSLSVQCISFPSAIISDQ